VALDDGAGRGMLDAPSVKLMRIMDRVEGPGKPAGELKEPRTSKLIMTTLNQIYELLDSHLAQAFWTGLISATGRGRGQFLTGQEVSQDVRTKMSKWTTSMIRPGARDNLVAGVGRVVYALALLPVVMPNIVQIILAEGLLRVLCSKTLPPEGNRVLQPEADRLEAGCVSKEGSSPGNVVL
jgi:hypothetical protein